MKEVDIMDWEPVLVALAALIILLIPATPAVILWFFLCPVTFWEKLAWLVVSSVFYYVLLKWEFEIFEAVF